MNFAPQTVLSPRDLARLLVIYPKRWLVPAAVVAAAAIAFAFASPATWEASQALIIRNEATSKEVGPGKFRQPEDMKTVQETILELARSRRVLAGALKQVGPPADYSKPVAAYPDDRDVESLRKLVRLGPPKGAEFGKTEVFYLEVRDANRNRALALAEAICEKLETRFQEVRNAKAQSMIDELAKTVVPAKADLDESTARVSAVERAVGADLAELRILQDTASGESALRRTATEIRSELRAIRTADQASRELLGLLEAAERDPGRLVATPNRLLESQPGLRRLKEGLIDAQLAAARLQGTMSAEHPLVHAAKESIDEVARHLHAELPIAVRGIEAELRLSGEREKLLEGQLADIDGRLERLAALRTMYANDLAENRNRATVLERAEQNLAEARAALASAKAASLIGRIEEAQAGTAPVGLGRTAVALLGIAGGVLVGLGVLYLTVPTPAPAAGVPQIPALPSHAANGSAARPKPTSLRIGDNLTFKQALTKLAASRA